MNRFQSAARISGLHGNLLGDFGVKQCTLADTNGTWLTINDLECQWEPTRLFHKKLHILSVQAARMDLARWPQGTEKTDPAPSPRFSLQTPWWFPALTINKLGIARLGLGTDIPGSIPLLSLEGSAELTSFTGPGRMQVHLHPLDQTTPQLDLSTLLEDNSLQCSGRYDDPTGRTTAFLAGLAEPLPLHIRLQGSGQARSYQGTLTARADTMGTVQVRGQWFPPQHNGTLNATVLLEEHGLLAPFAHTIGEQIGVDLQASTDRPGQEITTDFTLAGTWMTLAGTSKVDLGQNNTDTSFELRHNAPNRLGSSLGMGIHKLAPLTGSIKGPLTSPTLWCSVTAELLESDQIRLEKPRISLHAQPSLHTESTYGASLHVSLADITLPDILHSGPVDIRTMFDALGGKQVQTHLQTSGPLQLEGSALFTPASHTLSAAFTGNTTPATLIDPHLGPVPQSLTLSGQVQGNVSTRQGTARLHLDCGPWTRGPLWLHTLAGPSTTLQLATTIGQETITLTSLNLNATHVRASANGTMWPTRGDYQASLKGTIQTAPWGLDPAQLKAVDFTGELAGNATATRCSLSGNPVMPPASAFPLERIAVNATLNDPTTTPKGTWAARMQTLSGPLDLKGDLDLTTGMAISHGHLQGLGVKGTFFVDMPSNKPLTTVRGHMAVSSLEPVGTLLQQPVKGSLDMTGSYTGSKDAGQLRLSGWAHDLAYGQSLTIAGANLNRLHLNMDRLDQPDLQLTINNLATGNLHLENALFRTAREGSGVHLAMEVEGSRPAPLQLSLEGRTRSIPQGRILDLHTLEGTWDKTPIHLAAPTELFSSNTTLHLDPTTLHLGNGTLHGSMRQDAHHIHATMGLENLALNPLQRFSPMPLPAGILTANATLEGPLEHPDLQGTMRIDHLATHSSSNGQDVLAGTLRITAHTTPDSLRATALLTGVGDTPLEVAAQLPWTLSLRPLQAVLSPTGPVRVTTRGRVDLATVNPVLDLPDLDLEGTLDLDAALSGTIEEPALAGTLHVNQGRLEYIPTGTLVEQIQALVRLNTHEILLESCSATDGETGRLDAQGSMTLPWQAPLAYEVSTRLYNTRLLTTDTQTALVNGTCRVHGDADTTWIQGNLSIPRGNLDISRNPNPDLVPVEAREIHVQPEHRVIVPTRPTPPANINLDMAITIPGRMFVRGRGLESEWKGAMKIAGTTAAPVMSGTLTSIRGSLAFAGRDLNLTTGNIHLDGTYPPNPLLNIITTADIQSTEVRVKVQGTAQKPELVLESSPGLPEDKILALLLFGSPTAQLNPMQALQLANTARNLSGKTGNSDFNIMGFIRSLLGVDALEVGTDDSSGEMQVGVGKYLTDSIYVELKKGMTSDEDAVSAEMELTPNVGVETEAGTDSTGKVGIYWKKDY
jgi:translocation and assembly module TamB